MMQEVPPKKGEQFRAVGHTITSWSFTWRGEMSEIHHGVTAVERNLLFELTGRLAWS